MQTGFSITEYTGQQMQKNWWVEISSLIYFIHFLCFFYLVVRLQRKLKRYWRKIWVWIFAWMQMAEYRSSILLYVYLSNYIHLHIYIYIYSILLQKAPKTLVVFICVSVCLCVCILDNLNVIMVLRLVRLEILSSLRSQWTNWLQQSMSKIRYVKTQQWVKEISVCNRQQDIKYEYRKRTIIYTIDGL